MIDHIGIAVNEIEQALDLYRDTLGLNLERIHVVEEQKVKVVCRNCHQIKEATFFETHKELILKCKDTNSKLLNDINKQIKQQIKEHIRKKDLISDLWNGKCTNCGFGVTSENINNLPALEIQHEDPSLKKNNISEK